MLWGGNATSTTAAITIRKTISSATRAITLYLNIRASILGSVEGPFAGLAVIAGAFYFRGALQRAGIRHRACIAAEGEVHFVALHRSGQIRFAELPVIRSRQLLARLFEFERG